MAEEILKVSRTNAYATLSLNRAEKRNALNQPLLAALDKALTSIENDKSIRAVILRGEGKVFCSGIDLAEVDGAEGGHNPVSLEKVFYRLENLPVPTIASINGAALAGGLELALHCDLRVAGQSAKLGMTLGRVGLVVPYDFTRKLIEIIGASNTAEILYTADLFDTRRGREMGMVHQVVEDDKLDATVVALAEKVSANAPLALRAMKATIRHCMANPIGAAHKHIDEMATAARRSQDAKEGVRAFLEKRKPVWRAE